MPKRLTDTAKWEKRWFRKLQPKYKCFWNYICDRCNYVGVWEKDFELASAFIGEEIQEENAKQIFKNHIIELDGERWFILDFVEFQYKCEINNLNTENKIHQNIINALSKYRDCPGWVQAGYTLLYRVKEKEKEKEKKKGDTRGKKVACKKVKLKTPRKKYGEFKNVLLTDKQYHDLLEMWGQFKLDYMIRVLDEGIEMKGYKYKNFKQTLINWADREDNLPKSRPMQIEIEDLDEEWTEEDEE